MIRFVTVFCLFALGTIRGFAVSNSLNCMLYSYSAGDRITNESFKIWFFPSSTGCKILESEDVGNRTRMTESTYHVSSDIMVPRVYCMQLAELASDQSDSGANRESRGAGRVEAQTYINGRWYYCSIPAEKLETRKMQEMHNDMIMLCSSMKTNASYAVLTRQYYIDKLSTPAIAADVPNVISDPQHYVGKNVELTGYYTKYKEGGALFGAPPSFIGAEPALEYPYKGVWVGPVREKNAAEAISQCGSGPVRVRVLGMIFAEFPEESMLGGKLDPFIKTGLTAGPLGLWPLEIIDIRGVTILEAK